MNVYRSTEILTMRSICCFTLVVLVYAGQSVESRNVHHAHGASTNSSAHNRRHEPNTNTEGSLVERTDCDINEFFHPLHGCVACSRVCSPGSKPELVEQRRRYCLANCPSWCPEGSFFHPATQECIPCDTLCADEQGTGSESRNKFCSSICLRTRCAPENEFYHPVTRTCISCTSVCNVQENTEFCKHNCPRLF